MRAKAPEKTGDKGMQVWGKAFPKLPVIQKGQGRLDGKVLDEHYAKMLAIGQEGLKKFFTDDAGLSGARLRDVDPKERLKEYRKSLPDKLVGVERGQVWQAVQMASQDIFLKKELQGSEKIPPRHAWQFARHLNDAIKIRMLTDYLKKVAAAEGEVSANYVKTLMLEYKVRREYEQPVKEPEGKKMKITPQDILLSLARYDLSKITSMKDIEFMAMVNDLSAEQCKQLKDAIDRVKSWINKGVVGKSDYLDFKVSRKTS